MSRIDLSSPIAVVVDRACRAAVALPHEKAPSHGLPDGLGEGFIAHYFKSPHAVAEALCPTLIDFVSDPGAASLLDDRLKAQIRAESHSTSYELAVRVVARLSNAHQTSLQAAILTHLKSRAGTSFCFREPQIDSTTPSRSQRSFPPSLSNCPGREQEVDEIVGVLLSAERRNPSVVVGGVGGIGKTTLALTALNDGAVRDRYGNRRFWVNCETAYSAENFLENVIAVLSASATLSTLFAFPTNDVDQDFLSVLDRIPEGSDPAVVTFDNLETIFDTNEGLVERVLSLVLQRTGVVVTLRGERRPSIGNVWSWPTSEKTRLDQLPESAWLFAFETHAGRRLDDRAQTIVEPILRHIGGYPLAIFLLGRRLAHGQSSIDDLRQAWDSEISRAGTPDDTRQTCIIVSIRTSLRSAVMVNTPFAVETLVLAAHLPPGFCRFTLGDEVEALNGLPKWLGRALCGSDEARMAAWAALTRGGLAYSEPTGPDRLQLVPPVQEALRWHESIVRIPLSRQQALVEALDKNYREGIGGYFRAFSELDTGTYGKFALKKLGFRSSLVPAHFPPHDGLPSNAMAQPTHLLATLCRHTGFLVSGKILFHEADLQYTALNNVHAAMYMRASRIRLERTIADRENRLHAAMAFADEEALLWDAISSPQDAAWAKAKAMGFRAWIAECDNRLEEAARYQDQEVVLREQAGQVQLATWARAATLSLRAQIAHRDHRLEDGAGLREKEALLWDEAGNPQWAARARANASNFRSRIAERDDRLDDAARYGDEEAPLREQAGQVQAAAFTRAAALALRAQIADRDGRLDEAARLFDKAAPLYEKAGEPKAVAAARANALEFRSRVAERDDRLDDAARYRDEEAPLREQAGQVQAAAFARAAALDLRAQIADRDDRLDDGAGFRDKEAWSWEEADEPQAAASARANALELRSCIAERDNRFDDAARYQDEEAPLREQAGQLQAAAWARAKALTLRAQIADREGRLDEAARLIDNAAPLYEEAGKPQTAAWTYALGYRNRARMTEQEDRLCDALECHEAEAEWWDRADKPEWAAWARHDVEELRRRIAEHGQGPEDDEEGSDEVEQELEDEEEELEDEEEEPGFWTRLWCCCSRDAIRGGERSRLLGGG